MNIFSELVVNLVILLLLEISAGPRLETAAS